MPLTHASLWRSDACAIDVFKIPPYAGIDLLIACGDRTCGAPEKFQGLVIYGKAPRDAFIIGGACECDKDFIIVARIRVRRLTIA